MNPRPILVVALAIGVVVLVPLIPDLWRFAGRELVWWRFHRAAKNDRYLPSDWSPTASADLRQRLMRARDAR